MAHRDIIHPPLPLVSLQQLDPGFIVMVMLHAFLWNVIWSIPDHLLSFSVVSIVTLCTAGEKITGASSFSVNSTLN